MIDIEKLVKCITATRKDFSQLFLRAQYNLDVPVDQRIEFEAIVVHSADDRLAFREALEWCKAKGKLFDEMVHQIVKGGYDGGAFLVQLAKEKKLKKGKNSRYAPLQALSNPSRGWSGPFEKSLGIKDAYNWTGKVLVNGEPKGSGILIGPKRFLTAWHVIQEMFDPVPGSQPIEYRPKNNPPTLHVVFDDYDRIDQRRRIPPNPITIEADEDWIEVFSSTHPNETHEQIPDPSTDMDNYWDYAVIRLSKAPDNERKWVILEKRAVVPDAQANISVFQYPTGLRLLMDENEITHPDPPNAAVPRIRFLHKVNTSGGSSGGPCFDREFYLVGLHQGVWLKKGRNQVINRGIPIRNIIEHMETDVKKTNMVSGQYGDRPEDHYIWCTDNKSYDPVIGIDDLQEQILNNIRSEKGYVLFLQGNERSGKTYCVDAVIALLNNTDHLKIVLSAELISKMDALALGRHICSEAGVQLPNFVPLKDYNTTTSAWLKDEVVPKVIASLDTRRGKRMIWICIKSMNQHSINGENASEFLLLLYSCVVQNSWLQVLLDGANFDFPDPLAENVQQYETTPKTLEDIRDYITRFLKELQIKSEPMMTDVFSNMLFKKYTSNLEQRPAEAMKLLWEQSKDFFYQFLEKIKQN